MTDAPVRVGFSRHAERRLGALCATQHDVADALLAGHAQRRRNPRAADWLILAGRLAIAYNWPDRDDRTTALVVTVWRR